MGKESLRRILRLALAKLKDRDEQSAIIADYAMSAILPNGSICIYNALPSEVDTKALIEHFCGRYDVYLPVVVGIDIMLVKVDAESEYIEGAWGILEPKGQRLQPSAVNPSVTITPLLGVDAKLNRLGKGKGYYDRYFSKVDTLKVGLAFREQVVDSVPTNKWDRRLDMLITPDGIVKRSDICE